MKRLFIFLVLPWHLLTWDDFQETPEPGYTAISSIDLSFISHSNDGKYEFLDSVIVEFHPEASFSISRDPYVLNHEQGHLNIAYLLCRYINHISHIHHIWYNHEQYDAMMKEVTRRWHKQDNLYDQETNHSINHEMQEKWDIKIAKMLATKQYAEIH